MLFVAAGWASLGSVGAEPVEFRRYDGAAFGSVTVSFDSLGRETLSSDVTEISNVQGLARQVYTSIDLSQLPYATSGTITSYAHNGDELFLSFALQATGTTATGIAFVGEFHVLGGTGRNQFKTATAGGDYGSGPITGQAEINTSTPGTLVLSFRDTFRGVIEDR